MYVDDREMKPWMMVKMLPMYYNFIITKHVNKLSFIKNLTFNKILQWQARCEFLGGQKYAVLLYGIMHKLCSAKLKLF